MSSLKTVLEGEITRASAAFDDADKAFEKAKGNDKTQAMRAGEMRGINLWLESLEILSNALPTDEPVSKPKKGDTEG